jgi:creatinine amidohydrolase
MSFYFQDKSWLELKDYLDKGTLILLPLGTVEEHGPHMATGADAMIAEDTSRDIAEAFSKEKDVPPILVMPTFWSGYSMSIMNAWPGTVSVRASVVLTALTDIIGSLAKMGFYRIAVSNNHGHHDGICRQLVRDVADQYKIWISVFEPVAMAAKEFNEMRRSAPGGACHACEYETSLLLHYNRPVDMSKATAEDIMKYSSKFVPADGFCGSKKVIWSTWGLQQSGSGCYGDPTVASKETGRLLVDAMVKNSVEFLKEFCRVTIAPKQK